MSGGDLQVGNLSIVAAPLAQVSQDILGLASSAPEAPNAGPSTAHVGDFVSALARMIALLSQTSADLADAVNIGGENYFDTEQLNNIRLSASEHRTQTFIGPSQAY
ncbi:hypothetical protein ABH922_003654 [Rhodococcus sp. 27YEA15]|uniref:hypothetical protein n=1 Tax=Rhodococcus sp. 27YEA15 TaxID=3156259 RepID=UPI003C7B0527